MERRAHRNVNAIPKDSAIENESSSEELENNILLSEELEPFMNNIRMDDIINHILDPHMNSSIGYDTIDSKEIIDAFDVASDNIRSTIEKITQDPSKRLSAVPHIDIYARIKHISDIINDILKDFSKLEAKASTTIDNSGDTSELHASQDIMERTLPLNDENSDTQTDEPNISGDITHIREYLDKLKRESERTRELRSLMHYFDDFYRGKTDRLDPLAHSDTLADLLHAADVLKKLNQTVMVPALKGFGKTIQTIQEYTESFEQQILKEFQEACQEKDDTKMSSCSKILSSLNGGRSYIQAYVQNHEFFRKVPSSDQIQSIYQSSMRNPIDISSPPVLDPSIEKLYREIRRTCHNTWTSIANLFDQPHALMMRIVQRIFMEPVQVHIETILSQANQHSQLAYTQSLHICYISTKELLSDIQTVFESHHRRLSMYLEDLFSPYIERNKYIQSEVSNMKHLLHVLLGGWNSSILTDQLDNGQTFSRNKILVSLLKQHDSLWPEIPDSSLYLVNGQPLALKESKSSSDSDDPIAQLLFNKQIISCSIEILDNSISRVQVLCSKDQVPNAVLTLFSIFVYSIGEQFYLPMIQLLDSSSYSIYNIFSTPDPSESSYPNFLALRLVNKVNAISQAIQLYFQTSLTQLLIPTPQVFDEAMQIKNSLLSMMDSKLNHLIMKELDMMLEWIKSQLDKQNLSDYRPKKPELDNIRGNSAICNVICHFLTTLPSYILFNLDGDNVITFVEELCTKIFSLLMDHVRRFVINEAGAVLLNKDIAKYQEVIRLFQNDKVNLYFDVAREISKLFLIQPGNLKTLLLEGKALQYHHHQISTPSLYTFIICREDFKSANLEEGFVVKTHYQSQIARIFQ